MRRFAVVVLLLAQAAVVDAQTTQNVRAHDPSSIIQCQDEFWIFTTGSGVRAYRSQDLQNWIEAPRTLGDLPAWTKPYLKDDRLWAPDIIRAADGRYLLYYSASSFGKNTSAIGLAMNKTLDPAEPAYRWVDEGAVIATTSTDDYNAIDPAVTFDADGKMWLSFGSFWSGIKLIELDPRSGKRISPDAPLHALASAKEIEAPYIHRRGDKYYLFVNFGLCCRGVRSTYNIRVGRSDRITGPYLDRSGKDLRAGGGTIVLGTRGDFIGPGHASIFAHDGREWFSCHFYDGANRGRGTLTIRPLTWSEDGWPIVGSAEASARTKESP
jgi:arabinan endo-1,5-alpha-L-arabinosidase